MKKRICMALLALLLALTAAPARAQEDEPPLKLSLRRIFGYGGVGQIQGTFSLRANDGEDLAAVEFLIDDEVVAVDRQPPFEFRFNTGDFPEGVHTLSARGLTAAGSTLASNTYTREFLSADAAWRAAKRLLVPLLVGIGVLTLAGVGLSFLLGRGGGHRPGVYGLAGGAVCPRCGRPFSRHFWSPNLLAGKLERCPHCGKWALVRRASAAALQAAEEQLAAEAGGDLITPESEDDRLRRLLDESRYER